MKKISVVLPIKLADPWQEELCEFAIATMRMHTRVKYELIIVEKGGRAMKDAADKHIQVPEDAPSSFSQEFNQGIEAAEGLFVVHTALDVIVGEHWLEALLECFDLPDCGVSTLSVTEPGAVVGAKEPQKRVVEGMYGPIMMFPSGNKGCDRVTPEGGWRLDEAFPNLHSDSDLVMRAYGAGLRSYRNHRSVCHHLDGITWKSVTDENTRYKQREAADALFRRRYEGSRFWMATMILMGNVRYGREHIRDPRLMY